MSRTNETKIREFLDWVEWPLIDSELIDFAANIRNDNGRDIDEYRNVLADKHYDHNTNYIYTNIGLMSCFGEKIFTTDDVIFFKRLLV